MAVMRDTDMESKTAQKPLYGGVVGGKKIKALYWLWRLKYVGRQAPTWFPSLEPIAGHWLHGI